MIFAHADWPKETAGFEKRLGMYAYNHPDAKTAAQATLLRLRDVILKHYLPYYSSEDKIEQRAFLKNDKSSAGQIGQYNEDVKELINGNGNLRETLTAIFNGAFFPGDKSKKVSKGGDDSYIDNSFKSIIQKYIFRSEDDFKKIIKKLGLNEEALLKYRKYLLDRRRRIAGAFGGPFAPDIYNTGNLIRQSDQAWKDNWEMYRGNKARVKRSKQVDAPDPKEYQKTPRDYEDLQAPLSPREMSHAFGDESETHKDEKLPWKEGIAYWAIKDKPTWRRKIRDKLGVPVWVKEKRDKLGMPVTAGASATAARLLSTFRWLNVPGINAMDFRMALIGWMLTSQDHSLYEIMRGSAMVGFKGKNETLANAIELYTNIAPFSIGELRENVCKDGKFPHEVIYEEKMKNFKEPGAGAIENGKDLQEFFSLYFESDGKTNEGLENWIFNNFQQEGDISEYDRYNNTARQEAKQTLTQNMGLAQITALHSYTRGTYPFINAVLSNSKPIAKLALKHHIKKAFYYAMTKYEDIEYKRKGALKENILKTNLPGIIHAKFEEIKELIKYKKEHPKEKATFKTRREALLSKITGETNMEDLYNELTLLTNFTIEGLNMLPSVKGGTKVWRGEVGSWFRRIFIMDESVHFTTKGLYSTSRKESVAKRFANDRGKGKKTTSPVLLEIELKAQGGGKDITVFSSFGESEVLIMPGTEFEITDTGFEGEGEDKIWMIKAKEV